LPFTCASTVQKSFNLKIYTIYNTILLKILCPYCLVSSLPVSTVDNITVETFIEIDVWRYLLYCRGWSSFLLLSVVKMMLSTLLVFSQFCCSTPVGLALFLWMFCLLIGNIVLCFRYCCCLINVFVQIVVV